jgi:hypothetical protein
VKKKKTKPKNPIEKPLTEDEYYEMVSEESSRLEHESYIKHFSQFSKDELIQMIMEIQETEEKFSAWMRSKRPKSRGSIVYGGGLTAINNEFDNLIRERDSKIKNQRRGRQKQAFNYVAESEKAKALGIDDFYGLVCEAVAKFERTPINQRIEKTNTANIRKIIVDLLCQSNFSRHSYGRDKWIDIVKRNVTSQHIDNAIKKVKKNNPKAT